VRGQIIDLALELPELSPREQAVRFDPYFPHDPARVIHEADACLLDRYVQSSKMVMLRFSF
jgi:hypothetical protein